MLCLQDALKILSVEIEHSILIPPVLERIVTRLEPTVDGRVSVESLFELLQFDESKLESLVIKEEEKPIPGIVRNMSGLLFVSLSQCATLFSSLSYVLLSSQGRGLMQKKKKSHHAA